MQARLKELERNQRGLPECTDRTHMVRHLGALADIEVRAVDPN
jgi:hypothetical protein